MKKIIMPVLLSMLIGCAGMTSQQKTVLLEAGLYIGMTIAEAIIERGQPVMRYSPRGVSGEEYLVYHGRVLVFINGKLERVDG